MIMIKLNDFVNVRCLLSGKVEIRQVKSITIDFKKPLKEIDSQYIVNIEFYERDQNGINDYWFDDEGYDVDCLIKVG